MDVYFTGLLLGTLVHYKSKETNTMKMFVALVAAIVSGGLYAFGGAPSGTVNTIPETIVATGSGFEVPLIQAGQASTELIAPAFVIECYEVVTAPVTIRQDAGRYGGAISATELDNPKGSMPYCAPSVRNYRLSFASVAGPACPDIGGEPSGASLATGHDTSLANLRRTIELIC